MPSERSGLLARISVDNLMEIGLVLAIEVVDIPVATLEDEGEHHVVLVAVDDLQFDDSGGIGDIAHLHNLVVEIIAYILSADPVVVVEEDIVVAKAFQGLIHQGVVARGAIGAVSILKEDGIVDAVFVGPMDIIVVDGVDALADIGLGMLVLGPQAGGAQREHQQEGE